MGDHTRRAVTKRGARTGEPGFGGGSHHLTVRHKGGSEFGNQAGATVAKWSSGSVDPSWSLARARLPRATRASTGA